MGMRCDLGQHDRCAFIGVCDCECHRTETERLALVIANAEWDFQGVHGTFRVEPAGRHVAIAEAVLSHMARQRGDA